MFPGGDRKGAYRPQGPQVRGRHEGLDLQRHDDGRRQGACRVHERVPGEQSVKIIKKGPQTRGPTFFFSFFLTMVVAPLVWLACGRPAPELVPEVPELHMAEAGKLVQPVREQAPGLC